MRGNIEEKSKMRTGKEIKGEGERREKIGMNRTEEEYSGRTGKHEGGERK